MTTSVSCTLTEALPPTDWIARASRLDTGAWLADTALSATGGFTAACGTYAGPVMITTYPNIGVRWAAAATTVLNSYTFPTNCSTTPYFFKATSGPGSDTGYAYTSVLLHFNGSNGGTTFTDSSVNKLTVTPTGVTTSTATYLYGSAAASFPSSFKFLTIGSTTLMGFGTGDFTVELWVYFASISAVSALIDGTAAGVARTYDGATVRTGGTLNAAAWNHLAWVRISNVNTVYVNGASGHTWTESRNFGSSNPVCIGCNVSHTAEQFVGFMDDIQIKKGVGVYTTTFTPPVAELPGPPATYTSEPTWDTVTGNTTNDGTVQWTCMGPLIQPITQSPLIAA
jgi:hypothetical protein